MTTRIHLAARAHARAYAIVAAVALGAAPIAAQSTIRPGTTINASLEVGDRVLDDGSYYDLFTFDGSAGQHVRITLRSDDFDAYLALGMADDDGNVDYTFSDDDSGGGTDARVDADLDASGLWVIRANTLSQGESGDYSLTLEVTSGGSTATAANRVSASLGAGDRKLDDGSYYDAYTFDGRKGQTATIVMRSDDFDTYLSVGTSTSDGEFDALEHDDDGAGGTDSRVSFVLPVSGTYVIHANSLSADATGDYTLEISVR